MAAFCPHCRRDVQNDDRRCAACGACPFTLETAKWGILLFMIAGPALFIGILRESIVAICIALPAALLMVRSFDRPYVRSWPSK